MRAVARATAQVGVKRTMATTMGMRTSAVRTRVRVMEEKDSRYPEGDREGGREFKRKDNAETLLR